VPQHTPLHAAIVRLGFRFDQRTHVVPGAVVGVLGDGVRGNAEEPMWCQRTDSDASTPVIVGTVRLLPSTGGRSNGWGTLFRARKAPSPVSIVLHHVASTGGARSRNAPEGAVIRKVILLQPRHHMRLVHVIARHHAGRRVCSPLVASARVWVPDRAEQPSLA